MFLRSRKYFTLLVAALTTASVFAVVYSVSTPNRYQLKIGERSRWDISAPFDMEDRVQSEKFADEAAKAAPKAYVRDADLTAAIVAKTESFINVITQEHNNYRDIVIQSGPSLTSADIIGLRDDIVAKLCSQAIVYRVSISREEAGSIITDITRAELDAFFGEFLSKVRDIAENSYITAENYNDHVAMLCRSVQQTMYANQNLKNVASLFALSALSVNVKVDDEQTKQNQDLVREKNLERKIIIPRGKRLISIDDVVAAAQFNLLSEYGLIEDGELDVVHLIKVLFVLFGIAVLFQFYLSSVGMELLESNSQVLQLGCIIVVVLTACRFLYPVHTLAMPIYIAPILIAYLINSRVAIVINIYILSVISLFSGIDVKTMLFFLIGGALSAIMMMNASTRARFTLVAFCLSTTCVFLFIALSNDIMNPSNYLLDAAILFITCIASSFISMGLVALMESLFNTATPLRLTELSSGNTPLLRRLSFEAPGTHHHSLMVGYMAETAALDIGANPFIAKTGAYYHDVGKLLSPSYFSENQYGINPHDQIEPDESARIIVSHTTAGVELCDKGKLPKRVTDIVREHHGETMVAYFYNKAVKRFGDANVRIGDYRYPGPKPASREAALVMLADSCEAAVRSSDQKDEAQIAEWVRKIIRSKFDDGQLEMCMIGMRDLRLIEQSYIRVLTGFYHTRVRYPEDARQARAQMPPLPDLRQLAGDRQTLDGHSAQAGQQAANAGQAAYAAASNTSNASAAFAGRSAKAESGIEAVGNAAPAGIDGLSGSSVLPGQLILNDRQEKSAQSTPSAQSARTGKSAQAAESKTGGTKAKASKRKI
jgi:putative nucleotidyltransferase with HDIG domain